MAPIPEESYVHLLQPQGTLFHDMVNNSPYEVVLCVDGERTNILHPELAHRYAQAHATMLAAHEQTGLAAYVTQAHGELVRAMEPKHR